MAWKFLALGCRVGMRGMVSERIRAMRGPQWLGLFGIILLAWAGLFVLSMTQGGHHMSCLTPSDRDGIGCGVGTGPGAYLQVAGMWALMVAAMMLPTAMPAFAAYDDLSYAAPDTRFWHLVAGFVAVWLWFSLVAALLQVYLVRLGVLDALGTSTAPLLSAGLLALAGFYQLSPLKESCLAKCRHPLTFYLENWAEGPWRNGLRLGIVCLGCCWALMLLAFVGGMTNLAFMGLATLLMIVEKLPEIGRWVTWPLGVTLLTAAGFTALNAI